MLLRFTVQTLCDPELPGGRQSESAVFAARSQRVREFAVKTLIVVSRHHLWERTVRAVNERKTNTTETAK